MCFDKFKKINPFFLFFLSFATLIINTLIFDYLAKRNNIEIVSDNILLGNVFEKFLVVVLIGPLFETFVFNYLPYKILHKHLKSLCLIILINSILFSFAHVYSIFYVIMAFIGGLIFNTYFIFLISTKQKAFLYTYLLHAFYNFIGFILIEVLKIY